MPEYKKQHYVPKMYLKLFSKDGKTIEQITLTDTLHRNVPIANLCQKKYMYSKNPDMEKIFSEIEGLTHKTLNKLLQEEKINFKEYAYLLSYIGFQRGRTLLEKEDFNNTLDKLAKETMMIKGEVVQELKKKGITKEFLDKLTIGHHGFYLEKVLISGFVVILLLDLQMAIIKNNASNDFIFSDNPVVFYNRIKWDGGVSGVSSLGYQSPGLIIFFPLNSKTMLMLYDDYHYKIRNEEQRHTIIDSKGDYSYIISSINHGDDVEHLNRLQLYNCNHAVYFEDVNQKSSILKLLAKIGEKQRKPRTSFKIMYKEESEIIHIHKEQKKLKIDFSFLEIIRTESVEIRRSPFLSQEFKKMSVVFSEEIEKKRKKKP